MLGPSRVVHRTEEAAKWCRSGEGTIPEEAGE
jgi:hypothetical protein